MSLIQQLESGLMLLLAAILSMLPGLERERRGRPAGLRTHMVVGMGACLFTMLSVRAFPAGDPTRVAANIITGISFLGARVIFQRRDHIHELTTAANIWATAAVGMAVGTGAWFLAIIAVLMIWFILRILRYFSKEEEDELVEPE